MLGLKEQVEAAGDDGTRSDLLSTGQFKDEGELLKYIGEARQQIEKVQGQIAASAAAEAAAGGAGGDQGRSRGASEEPMEVDGADPDQQQPDQQPQDQQQLYPLLGVPDAELDESQRKEKRRQQSAKASAEGRARAAAKKEERARAAAARLAREDAKLAADPAAYVQGLRRRYATAVARAAARRRRRLGLPAEGGGVRGSSKRADPERRWVRRSWLDGGWVLTGCALSVEAFSSPASPPSTPTNHLHLPNHPSALPKPTPSTHTNPTHARERMRLLAQAAGGAKKKRGAAKAGGAPRRRGDDSEDDGFGADDADWDVYRQMHPESSDEGAYGEDRGDAPRGWWGVLSGWVEGQRRASHSRTERTLRIPFHNHPSSRLMFPYPHRG